MRRFNNDCIESAVHGAMDCSQKSFKLVWRFHQLLSGFLVKGHLLRVSRQSHLSVNNVGNEMIPGAVHRSPGIYVTAEENSEKFSGRGCATSHRLKWDCTEEWNVLLDSHNDLTYRY